MLHVNNEYRVIWNGLLWICWMELNMRGSHESEKKVQDFCFAIGVLAKLEIAH